MRLSHLLAQSAESIANVSNCENRSDSVRLDAELLIAYALKKTRSYLFAHSEDMIEPSSVLKVQELIARRVKGVPVAYLLGEKEFWSLPLKVDERVLIPRSDTEAMIEKILSLELPEHSVVADLGTGSGAIALALATERSSWFVIATDMQSEALQVAAENCHRIFNPGQRAQNDRAVGDYLANKSPADNSPFDSPPFNSQRNVVLVQAKWMAGLGRECFDLVVSNPPYIDEKDGHLAQGDVRFEPNCALVSADGGLADIETIIQQANFSLKQNGLLVLEHGFQQAEDVDILLGLKGYSNIDCGLDLSGQSRYTLAKRGG